jgi:23S rRNA (cytosine1962-C5)-methyltransferase
MSIVNRKRAPKVVVLKKNLARSIRQGHPWIYRDAVTPRGSISNGAVVEVRTKDNRPLARGYWDARSAIAVRVLESGGLGHQFANTESLVAERLRSALERRLARLDLATTNAFRWVHGEGDLVPGLHADVYAGAVAVRFDGDGARAFYEHIGPLLRRTAAGLLTIDRVIDRAARKAQGGPREIEVLENGHRFLVELTQGQKGGLFLDQRENRQRVAALAKGKSLLNLFGYTGGFSLYAAAAGARRTDTVDIAAPAIEAAHRNFELNKLSVGNAGFHAEDAFEFLAEAGARGEKWDIVVSDPPSFAPKKEALPSARHAYRKLHRLAASVVAPGGLLCAASCSSHMTKDEFLESIAAGARQAGQRWVLESVHSAAFDHPVIAAFPEGDYLKFAIGRVLPATPATPGRTRARAKKRR